MSLFQSSIFISFGSGSCGNCYYLGTPDGAILIDAGVGVRKLGKAFNDYGINRTLIRAILLTHDHNDHVKHAAKLATQLNVPVYALREVHDGMLGNRFIARKIDEAHRQYIEIGTPLQICDFTIMPFPVPHDASANTGYTITMGDTVFSLMTDVGEVTPEVAQALQRSTHVVLEANYDPDLLRTGHYPFILQERIRNGHGHLSNLQCAQALIQNYHPALRHVWLCHLSADNNRPDLCHDTIQSLLQASDIPVGTDLQLTVLQRDKTTGPFEINA